MSAHRKSMTSSQIETGPFGDFAAELEGLLYKLAIDCDWSLETDGSGYVLPSPWVVPDDFGLIEASLRGLCIEYVIPADLQVEFSEFRRHSADFFYPYEEAFASLLALARAIHADIFLTYL